MTDKLPDTDCGLVLCQSGAAASITVMEATKDGEHEAIICAECAIVLDISAEGTYLPKDTQNALRKHYKVSGAWRVGDPLRKGEYGTKGERGPALA